RRQARPRASPGAGADRPDDLSPPPGPPLRPAGRHPAPGWRSRGCATRAGRGPGPPAGEPRLPPAGALARPRLAAVMRIAMMHRRLSGGGTEADLRRMASGLAARGHEVHVFCARPDASAPGVHLRRVPVLAGGRLARLLSFALVAPRMVGREGWD